MSVRGLWGVYNTYLIFSPKLVSRSNEMMYLKTLWINTKHCNSKTQLFIELSLCPGTVLSALYDLYYLRNKQEVFINPILRKRKWRLRSVKCQRSKGCCHITSHMASKWWGWAMSPGLSRCDRHLFITGLYCYPFYTCKPVASALSIFMSPKYNYPSYRHSKSILLIV